MKNEFKIIVGVDVSSTKLDYCIIENAKSKQHKHGIVTNDYKGIRKLMTILEKETVELVAMENTGVYSVPLCFFLQEQQINYSVIAPLEIKRSQGICRGKNDKADAKDIALYAISHSHKIKLTTLPANDLLELRLLLAEREKLVKAIAAFSATIINENYLPKNILKDTLAHNKKTIVMLQKQLMKMEGLIEKLIAKNDTFKKQNLLLQTIPGVGKQTAANMIAATNAFTNFSTWRKFACYCGVAPFEYSSGTSIRGRTKVSQLANKKMKSLLNMAALSAKKHDTEIRQYYERKVKEGKNKMLVLNAIRCKIISRAFAVIKRDTPFVDTLKAVA